MSRADSEQRAFVFCQLLTAVGMGFVRRAISSEVRGLGMDGLVSTDHNIDSFKRDYFFSVARSSSLMLHRKLLRTCLKLKAKKCREALSVANMLEVLVSLKRGK